MYNINSPPTFLLQCERPRFMLM